MGYCRFVVTACSVLEIADLSYITLSFLGAYFIPGDFLIMLSGFYGGPLMGRQTYSPNVNYCVISMKLEVHRKPRNEVETQSP